MPGPPAGWRTPSASGRRRRSRRDDLGSAPPGQPRGLQPDRVADRGAHRHDQRGDRLRQRVDPGVGRDLPRQPVGQHRVDQRVLGAQQRACDAGLDVGLCVGDDRAAGHLASRCRRWSACTPAGFAAPRTRPRRGRSACRARPDRRPAGRPWPCPLPSPPPIATTASPPLSSSASAASSTSATVGSPASFSNRTAPVSGSNAAATPGTSSGSPRSMITNGRERPRRRAPVRAREATPSPNRILTGRWLRKAVRSRVVLGWIECMRAMPVG